MSELPHATVATVVENEGRYLLVREKINGQVVYNQPAGHIEPGESIVEAALRETLEETGWKVELTGFAGISVYHAANGVSYIRTTLNARPLQHLPELPLDAGILEAVWLNYTEILDLTQSLRSPIVLKVIEDHRRGVNYPLELIYEQS